MRILHCNKIIFLCCMVLLVSACGGGGGDSSTSSSTSSSAEICSAGVVKLQVGANYQSIPIEKKETKVYCFAGRRDKTYRVRMEKIDGYPAIAVHNNFDFQTNSEVPIVGSISKATSDNLIFTALESKNYVIETYGYEKSSFNIKVEEVSIDDYLTITGSNIYNNKIYYLAAKGGDLPTTKEVALYPSFSAGKSTAEISYNNSSYDWLTATLKPSNTVNDIVYDLAVTSTDLPIDRYDASIRFYVESSEGYYGLKEVSVYKDFSVIFAPVELPAQINATFGDTSTSEINLPDLGDVGIITQLVYGPDGMGFNGKTFSWQSHGPIFSQKQTYNYGVKVSVANIEKTFPLSILVNKPGFKLPIVRYDFNSQEMKIGDFDGDGKKDEFLFSDRINSLYTAKYFGGEIKVDWVYPYSIGENEDIYSIAAGDLNNDGTDEIIVGTRLYRINGSSDQVHLYVVDKKTSKIKNKLALGQDQIRNIQVADLDDDGKKEIVLTLYKATTSEIVVINADDLSMKWRSGNLNTISKFSIANVDADNALEIITDTGLVIDGATFITQWDYGSAFGSSMAVGDIDGDHIAEIMFNSYNTVYALDANSKTIKFTTSPYTVSDITIADVDGDGINEVDMNGKIYEYQSAGNTLIELSQPALPGDPVKIDDFDSNGTNELTWFYSGILTITKPAPDYSILAQKRSSQLEAGYSSAMWAKTSATKHTAIFGSYSRDNSHLFDMDTSGNVIESLYPTLLTRAEPLLRKYDIDADGFDDIYMALKPFSDIPVFNVVDPLTGSSKYSFTGSGGYSWFAMDLFDVNGDHNEDMLLLANGGDLYFYDVAGSVFSKLDTLSSDAVYMKKIDVDSDGIDEVVILKGSGIEIYSLRNSVLTLKNAYNFSPIGNRFLVADLDGDGEKEFIFYSSSDIEIRNSNFDVISTISYPETITDITTDDLFDGRKNLIIGSTKDLNPPASQGYIRAVDPYSGTVIWKSPILIGSVEDGSLNIADVYGDNSHELVFGTTKAMYITQ